MQPHCQSHPYCVVAGNIYTTPLSPPWKVIGNSKGEGAFKANFLGRYEVELEFPECWRGGGGGVWIFRNSGRTHSWGRKSDFSDLEEYFNKWPSAILLLYQGVEIQSQIECTYICIFFARKQLSLHGCVCIVHRKSISALQLILWIKQSKQFDWCLLHSKNSCCYVFTLTVVTK